MQSTPFEQEKLAYYENRKTAPRVSFGDKDIPFYFFRFNIHKGQLKMLSIGLKFRQFKLKDLKLFYGLKGKTAKDCLAEFEILMAKELKEHNELASQN